MLNRYRILEQVGEGTFSRVFKAIDQENKQLCAIKSCKISLLDNGIPEYGFREISILNRLSHANILNVKEVITESDTLYMISEYIDLDLEMYIRQNAPLSPFQIKSILRQILEGTHYMHTKRVFHRDLKPRNILVTADGCVKIADFGLARTFNYPISPYTSKVQTLSYRSPEVLLGSAEYYTPIDVWSIGCIFAELSKGQPLFIARNHLDQLFAIFRLLGTPTEEVWRGVSSLKHFSAQFPVWNTQPLAQFFPELGEFGIDLLARMLTYDPMKRISSAEALQHPYFYSV